MDPADYFVIAAYAVSMLVIGWYYSLGLKTSDDYLLGGRTMNPWMVGLSLFATLTSTLSYLAYPGEVVKYGPMMLASLTGYPLAFLLVGWWLIPAIMRVENVTSGYELLELRLGLIGRLMGAGMFVLLRTAWMASILYATSDKVVVPLFGLEELSWRPPGGWGPWVSVALGLLTVIYTSQGGMKAVVVTDALQSLIMCAGAVITIAVVTVAVGGFDWFPRKWAPHWQEPIFWFRTDVRVTFMGALLNMLVWMVCTAGSDQMAVQRYLSTRDVKSARSSFGVHIFAEILMGCLLACVGLAVLAYYTKFPGRFGEGADLIQTADRMFPEFVVHVLPAGLSGIVVAAMLSAAMSSLSSGMNSASAVISTDFIGRFSVKRLTHHEQLRLAKLTSVVIGLAAIGLSTMVGQLAGNLWELCIKVVNLLTAPLFNLFLLALFVPWATPAGGIAGTIASVTTAVAVAFFGIFGLEFLWTGPCALTAGSTVGILVSLITAPAKSAGRIEIPEQDRE